MYYLSAYILICPAFIKTKICNSNPIKQYQLTNYKSLSTNILNMLYIYKDICR